MLDYEWGNPSTIMLTGNDDAAAAAAAAAAAESDQTHRQIFDHYGSHPFLPDHLISQPPPSTTVDFSLHHHSLFDPRAFAGASSSSSPFPPPQPAHHHHSMFSLDPLPPVNAGPGGLLVVPKSEDMGRRIGLNLGGRTYFASSEDDFVSRLYRRSRPVGVEPGSNNASPRCQAEGCNADLSHAKHYHRRHKVCEFHSKAATVIAAGLTQRFCQQCSRFHVLSEFDNGKRSCRKRLADHNRRRRKTQHPTQDTHKPPSFPRSPPESGAQSSSSVTVAVSPPDYFRQSSSATSSTLFFSTG